MIISHYKAIIKATFLNKYKLLYCLLFTFSPMPIASTLRVFTATSTCEETNTVIINQYMKTTEFNNWLFTPQPYQHR